MIETITDSLRLRVIQMRVQQTARCGHTGRLEASHGQNYRHGHTGGHSGRHRQTQGYAGTQIWTLRQTDFNRHSYLVKLGLQTDILQQTWTDKQHQIYLKADRQKRASDTATNTARCMVMSQIYSTALTQCLPWARYMLITSFCPHNYSMR